LLPCEAAPEELFRLCMGGSAHRSFALWSLLETARMAPLFGVSPAPLFQAFFSRLSLPFSFFVLSFFAAAWGMRLRSRYASPPPVAYFLFLPLLPLVTSLIFHSYLYGLDVVQGFLLATFGFYISLAAFCLVQGMVLFAALLVFAQQLRR
ncbi:MAG: hypothetical protein FWG35_05070, partial [Spirochaetaceae bacterium]|nr:hypothetical protein [Spirochaetaceae bacterium]